MEAPRHRPGWTVGIVQLCSFWPLAHGLSSISPIDPRPFSKARAPAIHSFWYRFPCVLFRTSYEKVSYSGRQRRETLSCLMQQYVVFSSHLSDLFHYWWLFLEELLGYKFQPAAPDPWVTGNALHKTSNTSFIEEGSAWPVYQISNVIQATMKYFLESFIPAWHLISLDRSSCPIVVSFCYGGSQLAHQKNTKGHFGLYSSINPYYLHWCDLSPPSP